MSRQVMGSFLDTECAVALGLLATNGCREGDQSCRLAAAEDVMGVTDGEDYALE
jgi:hypothetical protein